MLGRSRRHLRRYREMAGVLAKHGWGWVLHSTRLGDFLGRPGALTGANAGPEHVRQTLEELGPTFVKMGQLLSTRPDIVPEAYLAELVKLQDTAPTIPFEDIKAVIESEFDVSIGRLYTEFDETPVAAASLGQVHRARLSDGTQVMVKVQRPNVREQIETDIEILYKRAQFLEQHWEVARTYGIADIVDEFAITIREELDYTREARNTDRLREMLQSEKRLNVPEVQWQLTTNRVLTLQMMSGIKVTDLAANCVEGVDPVDVSNRLASSFMEQVFIHRFFHADPHPGNILVNNEGDIALLDCGQVGRLDSQLRSGAVRLMLAFQEQNTRGFADEVIALGITEHEIDMPRFTQDMGKVLRSFYDTPASSVNMGSLLTRVLTVSARHRIRLPSVFAVLGKVFANIDGICRQLNPEFNFTELVKSYVGKAVRTEIKSESTIAELYRAIASIKNLLFNVPEQLDRLIRKAVDGTLRIEFKHQGLEDVSNSFRNSANRISIALIVGAIIVGSSLVSTSPMQPTSWFGVPRLGLFGYVLATLFGVWLIWSVIRSGKQR